MFAQAVEDVLGDDSLQLPSPIAAAALQVGKILRAWCQDAANQCLLYDFAIFLHYHLEKALNQTSCKFHRRREKMWGSYFAIRTSSEFVRRWTVFLESTVKCGSLPILYQTNFFRKMINAAFPVSSQEHTGLTTVPAALSYQELNIIRYAAGYVCRIVKKKIPATKTDHRLSLDVLLSDGDEDDDVAAACHSRDWTTMVDRGGLLHVSDDGFDVFVAMEEVIRGYYHVNKASDLNDGKKDEIVKNVIKDDGVMCSWSIVAADMNKKVADELIKLIVEEWVKIRGFSFAGSWLELYKQRNKKTLQRSKGIRKQLITPDSTGGAASDS